MPRIRSIKPDVCESESFARLDRGACFTFSAMWTQCDDRGRRRADPRLLKADVYPLRDDVTASDMARELDAMEDEGMICRYVGCDGKAYLHVMNWDHQRVDNPGKSRIPPCRTHEPEADCHKHNVSCESHPLSRESRESVVRVSRDVASPSPTDLGSRILDLGPRTEDSANAAGKPAATLAVIPPQQPDTITQRSKRITDAYAEVEPMCRWPAVNGVVLKALKAGRWRDEEIRSGLLRLADEGRSVTVETLRTELAGLPPSRAAPPRQPASTTDARVASALALSARYAEEDS